MARTALLVIDMQKSYFKDPVLQEQQGNLVARCNELVTAAREHNLPIWNVVTEHSRDQSTWTLNMTEDQQGFLFAGTAEAEVVDGLNVTDAKPIIKTRDSAFFDTDLRNELEAATITQLIICGVSTQSCITQTAADAYAANFTVILADDAIATNKPAMHDPMLELLANEYRQRRATNDEIIRLMAKG